MTHISTDTYTKVSVATIVLLAIIAVVLTIVTINKGFYVKHTEFVTKGELAEYNDQRLSLTFNNPLSDINSLQVSITPESSFNIFSQGNKLSIIFDEPLIPDVQYDVSLSEEITDIYGDPLQSYEFSFKTRKTSVYYIKDIEDTQQIVKANTALTEENIVFESKEIVSYSLSYPYLLVISERPGFTIVDLQTETEHYVGSNNSFIDIEADQQSGRIFALTDHNFEFSRQNIVVYDSEGTETDSLQLSDNVTNVDWFNLHPNGSGIVFYSLTNSTFYFSDFAKISERPFSLGGFRDSGGFNATGERIVFTNFVVTRANAVPETLVMTSEEETFSPFPPDTYTQDPDFLASGWGLAVSKRREPLPGAKGIFDLVIWDKSAGVNKQVSDPDGRSLELPIVSNDGRYIALEAYTKDQLLAPGSLRDQGIGTKPDYGTIVIYDQLTEELINSELTGRSVLWD